MLLNIMDFGPFVNKLREEGKLKLQFECEQELINLLQEAQINGFECGYEANSADREILYYKEKVEAVEKFLDAFYIPRM